MALSTREKLGNGYVASETVSRAAFDSKGDTPHGGVAGHVELTHIWPSQLQADCEQIGGDAHGAQRLTRFESLEPQYKRVIQPLYAPHPKCCLVDPADGRG